MTPISLRAVCVHLSVYSIHTHSFIEISRQSSAAHHLRQLTVSWKEWKVTSINETLIMRIKEAKSSFNTG